MRKVISRLILALLVLFLVGWIAVYFGLLKKKENGLLQASGTVEAEEVAIASEVSGRIIEALVDEGDVVNAGDVLLRFTDDLLAARLQQAEAALAQAEANYELIAAQPIDEEREVAVAMAELELLSAQQALDDLYESYDLTLSLALQAIADAQDAVRDAERYLNNLQTSAKQADIDQAKANVVLLKDKLDKAREDFEPYENKPEDNVIRAALLSKLAQVQNEYDNAVRRLNNLLGVANEIDLAQAEAALAVAQAQLKKAERDYQKLEAGPDPDAIALAEARIQSAKAKLALAKVNTREEQLALAQAQVESARAALRVIQAQYAKLSIISPIGGIVLYRSVDPGEYIFPGSPAITIGLLDKLSITVYIAEDRYGQVSLGDRAIVEVDSFPGEEFQATVVRIADKAEYTPRNVQTTEGRRTTVFAVELSVQDPEGKLKPGMPADVVFLDASD